MYDSVRIHFVDGTDTLIYVDEDESIEEAVAQVADEEGLKVAEYFISGAYED